MTAPPTAWAARAAQAEIYERLTTMVETSSLEAATALFSQIPVPSIFADVSSYSPIPDVRPAVLPTILRGAGSSNLPSREQLARITQPTLILSWATDPTPPVSVAEELARIIPKSLPIATGCCIRERNASVFRHFLAHFPDSLANKRWGLTKKRKGTRKKRALRCHATL